MDSHRHLVWVSLPVVTVIVFLMARSGELEGTLVDRRVALQQLAALATGVTAAAVASATTVPGYPRWIVPMPLVPLAVWLGNLVRACIQDGLALGASS